MGLGLAQYEDVVSVDVLEEHQLRTVIALILDNMNLDIVREQTPDYTAFELRPRRVPSQKSQK